MHNWQVRMSNLEIYHKQLTFKTKGNKTTYFDIKEDCMAFLKETKVLDGILIIQSPHTTCSVFLEERSCDYNALDDEYLQHDLNRGLNLIFSKQLTYDDYYKYPGPLHRAWGMKLANGELKNNSAILLNADAHLKATIVGANVSIIIKSGEFLIGENTGIYFVDFDGNRARKRSCNLCCLEFK